MTYHFTVYDYVEGTILSWLMSLKEEDYLKGTLSFTLKGEMGGQKIALKYFITINKEMRKRIKEEKRIATGIIRINISRRFSIFKKKKKVSGNKKEFQKVEIILKRIIEEKPTEELIDEEALLVDILLSEAPRGSVPIYLLAVAHRKIKPLLEEIKSDIEELLSEIGGNLEIREIEAKMSSRKTKISTIDVLQIFLTQILGQALDEDELKSLLLEFKRIYGFEEKKVVGRFRDLYEEAFTLALKSFTIYLNIMTHTYNKNEIFKAIIEAFPLEEKAKMYLKKLSELSKEIPKKYSRVLDQEIKKIIKGTTLELKKGLEIFESKSKIIEIVKKYWGKDEFKIFEEIKKLPEFERNAEAFEIFIKSLFMSSDIPLSAGEKIAVSLALISYFFSDSSESFKNLLQKIDELSFPSRSLSFRIFDIFKKSLEKPNIRLFHEIDRLHKLLIYPLNMREEFSKEKHLLILLILSFGVKISLAKKMKLIQSSDIINIIGRYSKMMEGLGVKEEIVKGILQGIINV